MMRVAFLTALALAVAANETTPRGQPGEATDYLLNANDNATDAGNETVAVEVTETTPLHVVLTTTTEQVIQDYTKQSTSTLLSTTTTRRSTTTRKRPTTTTTFAPTSISVRVMDHGVAETYTVAEMPSFLQLATDNQKKEYFELDNNQNIPRGMKQKALLAWAVRCKTPILDQYQSYVAEEAHSQEEKRAMRALKVTALSTDAQAADALLTAIYDDMSLTTKQAQDQIKDEMALLKKKVRKELESINN